MRISIALVVFLVAAACGDRAKSTELSTSDAARALENRNWMDLWPQGDREALHVYRFTPAMGGGVFQDRTLYAGAFELFNYEIGTRELTIRWPHTKENEKIRFRIDRVSGPEPFDLRLRFEGNLRGPSVYYGRSAETSASLDLTP